MSTQTPDEILALAAQAASAVLPALEAEYAALISQADRLMTKITKLRAIATVSGADPVPQAVTVKPEEFNLAMQDIEEVMRDGPVRVAEIHERISAKFGRKWGDSTIYNHLTNGKTSGRYINENKRWSLAHPV